MSFRAWSFPDSGDELSGPGESEEEFARPADASTAELTQGLSVLDDGALDSSVFFSKLGVGRQAEVIFEKTTL